MLRKYFNHKNTIVLLAFCSCCSILCSLNCVCPFPIWCLRQAVEFDCTGSWSLPFDLFHMSSLYIYRFQLFNIKIMYIYNILNLLIELGSHYVNRNFYDVFFVLRFIWGPRVKFVQWNAFKPPVVYTTDRYKVVVPMLFLFGVAL